MSEQMTRRQVELARHALGLPNDGKRSYRNRFVAGEGHSDHADWLDMVDSGFAVRRVLPPSFGGSDLFQLTLPGARRALERFETLDPEDFTAAVLT